MIFFFPCPLSTTECYRIHVYVILSLYVIVCVYVFDDLSSILLGILEMANSFRVSHCFLRVFYSFAMKKNVGLV
jgi:hypothetical protein